MLEYSTDGGATFTTIAAGLANSGSYNWTVPSTPSANALVRVVVRDAVGNTGSDISDAAFTISDQTAPSVTVNSPNGGETWIIGAMRDVTWSASDNVAVASVELLYSTDNGASYTSIATVPGNTTSYAWTIPDAATTTALVKAVATDAAGNMAADVSDATFTIAAAPPPGSGGFTGLDFSDTLGYVPPDSDVAVGPNYVVETVNTTIGVYDKSGNLASKQDLRTLFGLGINTNDLLTDPAVTYDDIAQRFVVTALDFHGASTFLLFGVSDSADPTAGFNELHAINVTQYSYYFGTLSGDFPRLGFNYDEYVVSLNMFSAYGFSNVQLVTLNKDSVLDANPATLSGTLVSLPAPDAFTFTPDVTLVPATMHGAQHGDPMYFVEERLNYLLQTTNSINVVRASNLLTAPSLQYTTISVASYSQPPSATQPGGTQIQTNDSRILSVDWRNDHLVASQTVGQSDGLAHARWYEINTSGGPTLEQQGTIGVGSGLASYYPSISIAPDLSLGMTFLGSSATTYMSMYITGRTASDAPGAMQRRLSPRRVKRCTTASTALPTGPVISVESAWIPRMAASGR